MIKFFARCKHRKGFTLTELIVVVALLALIMACVVAFASPVRSMIGNTTAKDDAAIIDKIVADYIERQLSYANQMTIYAGIDYNDADTNIADTFNNYKEFRTNSAANNSGMLIFKYYPYDENTGTYRVLNYTCTGDTKDEHGVVTYSEPVPTKEKLVGTVVTNGSSEDISYTATDDSKQYAVFDDAFYSAYDLFISTGDTTVGTNAHNKAYLSFFVNAYKHPDTSAIKNDTMSKYSDFISGTTTDNVLESLDVREQFLGTEKVSFEVQNVRVKTEYVSTTDVAGDITYSKSTTSPNITITRGTGKDVVIFYNIQKYGK